MPQISKIRITNFTYNDGKRLIADELFDFANKEDKTALNSLINLKNGGGKSVLVQLMLQPIHPKARVAGRKIESFFTKSSDHCFVAIEWFKDNSTEKLMTGIAMASGESTSSVEDDVKGRPVKYYTFISNYSDYSNTYSIVKLPLSKREGSGFTAAAFNEVRDLAKKSNGLLDYYVSDDSRQWREKLAEYGIVQEEWKNIIEELNSVEGGMTEFFAKFKESDQLINRLLIPTIEGKFGQSSVNEDDSSLSTMLIEHAKAYNKQKDLINEKEACQSFQLLLSRINEMVHNVWNRNDDYEKKLQTFAAFNTALRGKKEEVNENLSILADAIRGKEKELEHIDYEENSEGYYKAKEKFEEAENRSNEIERGIEENKNTLVETSHKINSMLCAKLYSEICSIEDELRAIQSEIRAKSENEDSAKRLNDLGFSVIQEVNKLYPLIKDELTNIKEEYTKLDISLEKTKNELKGLQNRKELNKTAYDHADEAVKNACNETDRVISALGIDVSRYLDGCYKIDDLKRYKEDKDKIKDKQQTDIEKNNVEKQKFSSRNTEIEVESREHERNKLVYESERKALQEDFDKYADLERDLKYICETYNLEETDMYHGYLLTYLKNQKKICITERESKATKIAIIEDEIQAAENGYVHVPKRVIEYLNYSGITYQTCENYLNSIVGEQISKDQCLNILKNYPALAYGIILDEKEKAKLASIERELEDWLPSMVPVFAHEQLEMAISVQKNKGGAIAFYSEEYFSSRESFIIGIKSKKEQLEKEKNLLADKLEGFERHQRKVEEMLTYNEYSRQSFEMEFKRIADGISKITDKLDELDKEKKANTLAVDQIILDIVDYISKTNDIQGWLEKYENLLLRLDEESGKKEDKAKAYRELENVNSKLNICQKESQELERKVNESEEIIREKEAFINKVEEARTELGDISSGELIEGEWDRLLEEYRELKKSQNEAIAVLREKEEGRIKRVSEKKTELNKYGLPEDAYITLVYNDNALEKLEETQKELTKRQDNLQTESDKANRILGECKAIYSIAQKSLSEYDGVPLEKENIQGNYKERRKDTKIALTDLNRKKEEENKAMSEVTRFMDLTQYTLKEYKITTPSITVKLEENIENQYNNFSSSLKDAFDLYKKERGTLANILHEEVLKESKYQFNELHALKSFLKMVNNDDFKGDKYFTLSEQVEGVIKATELRFSQIETDLEEFNKSKSDLLRQCVFQGRRVYEGLRSMSKSSAVSISEGRPRKQMMKIDIPEEIDTNVAEATIDTELDTGIQELVELLNKDSSEADIRKTADRVIGSQTLLRKYVGKDNIRVYVYKIDLNPENARYRTWRETQINSSGGEKLVSYFTLILSLLNYSRSDYGDINDKSLTSVLILDNPFGAVSSGHLLKPMFEIAKHFRVQLICLSDINKADITACFDNFIKAVVKPLKYSSFEMLTHEGNEAIEHGFYRSEQMTFL